MPSSSVPVTRHRASLGGAVFSVVRNPGPPKYSKQIYRWDMNYY
jgi:hypothetical protein